MSKIIDPSTIATICPQGRGMDDVTKRREVKLSLVVETYDGKSKRCYKCNADDAWSYFNEAYDHCRNEFEHYLNPDTTVCYYKLLPQ